MTPATFVYALLAVAPWALSCLPRPWARRLAEHGPPRLATTTLTVCALTLALVSGMALCLTAYLGTVELLPAVHPSDWSADVLAANLRIPIWFAVGCGVAAIVLLVAAFTRLIRLLSHVRRSHVATRKLTTVDLAVIDSTTPVAYAAPAWFNRRRGRIVLSQGLIASMTASERRALIAHERSHLDHNHHLYAILVRLAAAANPLVRGLVKSVDHASERWADADAARVVGDPTTVARALGHAALTRANAPAGALGAVRSDVVLRVRELLEPEPSGRRPLIPAAAIATVSWLVISALVIHGHAIVEIAERGAS